MAGIASSIRSRGRQSFRAARRLGGGARSLGVGATTAWAWSKRPAGASDAGPAQNSSFTWVSATPQSTTRLVVHNYWSDAYGIDRPEFDAALLDCHGRVVDRWSFTLEPDATEVIDVRDRCREATIPLPFEGQLLLVVQHEKLVPGRPVQHYADYLRDDGEASGVHGQYGLIRLPIAQGVGTMRVEAGAGQRTALVLHNGYAGPGSPTAMRVPVEVYAADGRVRTATVRDLGAGESRLVWLDDCFEDLASFLGGRPGHARVRLGCPSSRVFTFVTFPPDERMVVDHGTVDRLLQQDPGVPVTWTRSRPVLSMMVWCDRERDTVVTLPNLWGPVRAAYPARIDVYDEAGQAVASEDVVVPPGGLAERSLGALLRDNGVHGRFTGNAVVYLEPPSGVTEMPAIFDGLLGLRDGGELVGEVQVGSEFYNADMPPTCRQPDIRRTRIFGRVEIGDRRHTWIHLAYPVGDDGLHDASDTLLTLLDETGRRRSTSTISLPPQGSVLAAVEELFPDAAEVLGPSGIGTLRVRDTTARLYGYAALARDGAQTMAIDHLTGG